MAQPVLLANPAHQIIHDLIGQHSAIFKRISEGQKVSWAELEAMKSRAQIMEVMRQNRIKANSKDSMEQFRLRDRLIGRYALGEALNRVMSADDEAGLAAGYTLAVETMRRFDIKPREYLNAAEERWAEIPALQVAFHDGALAYTKLELSKIFEEASLYPGDYAVVMDPSQPANDRLAALVRPLDDKVFRQLMDGLEEALTVYDANADLADYVEQITPGNLSEFYDDVVDPLADVKDQFHHFYGTFVFGMDHSDDVAQRAKTFKAFWSNFASRRLSFQTFINDYIPEDSREEALAAIQSGALAYVHQEWLEVISKKDKVVSDEDDAIIRDETVLPIHRLDALFRTADKAHVWLNLLEDVGFELEKDGSLTGLIVEAGQKAPVVPLARVPALG